MKLKRKLTEGNGVEVWESERGTLYLRQRRQVGTSGTVFTIEWCQVEFNLHQEPFEKMREQALERKENNQ